MCVIACYIGEQPAAPILLEMLKREEGFAGGFYSGIATVHEGQLYHAKVVGNTDTLIQQTDAASLPGTIGIIHSRTPSGGGRQWAHPFVDAQEKLAYIANGGVGIFDNLPLLAQASERLLAAGHQFRSLQAEPVPSYPILGNGLSLHFSDLICQAIADAYQKLADGSDRLLIASSTAYEQYPGELVGLTLHADHPDEIVAIRHNKPLIFGRSQKGELYGASTSIAFPEGIRWKMRMPPLSGARLLRNGEMIIRPFASPGLMPIGEFPSSEIISQRLLPLLAQEEPASIELLCNAAAALYPAGVLNEKETIIFEELASLAAEKRVTFHARERGPLQGAPVSPITLSAFCN